ncbi:MAG: alpha/beta hydrolase [Rhizobacter sp.]|nr:alpha/beta hydrolase [Ferruginibacter sp.]
MDNITKFENLYDTITFNKMRRLIVVFISAIPFCTLAQERDTTFKLNSVFVNDSFKITIGQIIKTPSDKTFFPVYTLDGDETFTGSKFALNALNNLAKNILIVSIGYGAKYGQKTNMRDRDYSPIKTDTSSGKKFLQFISEELIPFMEKKFELRNERTLVGYSAGANFCLYTLFTNQKIFTNYLAGSIGSSLDSNYIFDKIGKAKLRKLKTRLFISSGSKENWATEKMISILYSLTNKNQNLISIKQRVFDGQEHGIMGAYTFLKESLRWTFIEN